MRVLHVNATMDPTTGGGTAERTFQLCRGLAAGGAVEPAVLTLDIGGAAARLEAVDGLHTALLPCLNRRFYLPAPSGGAVVAEVARADVVLLMGHWTVLNALAYRAARHRGVPYVFCPAGALRVFGRSRLLKDVYSALVGQSILHHATALLAITQDERDLFVASGADPARCRVIPNGIHPADYTADDPAAFRRRHNLPETAPILLFLGRLNAIKGPDLLLEAFASVAGELPHHLVLAGPDDGLGEALDRQARQLGQSHRIHRIGHVGGAEKSQALHAAEALVIPSRHEAMSIVVLEAGVAGRPVLLTDRCGFTAVAENDGGVVCPATVGGLADGLRMLMCRSETDRRAMGARLRELVLTTYTWEAAAAAHADLYARVRVGWQGE